MQQGKINGLQLASHKAITKITKNCLIMQNMRSHIQNLLPNSDPSFCQRNVSLTVPFTKKNSRKLTLNDF